MLPKYTHLSLTCVLPTPFRLEASPHAVCLSAYKYMTSQHSAEEWSVSRSHCSWDGLTHQQERSTLVITRLFVMYVLQSTGTQATAPCVWVKYKQSISHAQNSRCVTLPLARLRQRRRGCGLLLCSDS